MLFALYQDTTNIYKKQKGKKKIVLAVMAISAKSNGINGWVCLVVGLCRNFLHLLG